MSNEELEPAKYEWKQYGIKVKIDYRQFDDIRNVQAYLRIKQKAKQKAKQMFNTATTNTGLIGLYK